MNNKNWTVYSTNFVNILWLTKKCMSVNGRNDHYKYRERDNK